MSKPVSIDEMINVLNGFEQVLMRDADKYPREILTQVRRFIVSTGTIDTTALLVTFDFHEIASKAGKNFVLEPNQPYGRKEGFVEFDRPAYGFEGRLFIKKGIENANLERISDEITFAAFE